MMLKILGSGICVPSAERNFPTNYIKIKSTEILVDCEGH